MASLAISVVIPTHNRLPVLKEALRYLAAGSVVPSEVIVVDDGSDEPVTPHIEHEDLGFDLRIIRFSPGRGAPAARNAGMREARGDVLVMLDDDIFVNPDTIRYHQQIHERYPKKTYGVMSRIYFDPDLPRTPLMHFLEEYGSFKGVSKAEDRTRITAGLISANFSLKRAFVQEQEALFDEDFPFNRNEDTEFGLRMAKNGLELRYHIAPHARHHSTLSLENHFEQVWQGGVSKAFWAQQRPDDRNYCLLLGYSVMHKVQQERFAGIREKYIETFGPDFLESDASAWSVATFENFETWLQSMTAHLVGVGMIDGWLEAVPSFPATYEDIQQAFSSTSLRKRLVHLRRAYERDPQFLPMTLLLATECRAVKKYEEGLTVLAPCRGSTWARLEMAKCELRLGHYDVARTLFQEVYDAACEGKAAQEQQRRAATDMLVKHKKNMPLDVPWARRAWDRLSQDDFCVQGRPWVCLLNDVLSAAPDTDDFTPLHVRFASLIKLRKCDALLREAAKDAMYKAGALIPGRVDRCLERIRPDRNG